MLALIHATYPGTAAKKLTAVYTSPDLPKRPAYAKEVASFVYGDRDGSHALLLLDVEDARIAEWSASQTERDVFIQSRVEGLRTEVHLGLSIPDAIRLASKHFPQ